MNLKFAFLADGANRTADGKLNVLGVFGAINGASFPLVHPQMALVIGCEFVAADAGGTKTLRARLLTEDGLEMAEVVITFTLPPPPVPSPRIERYEVAVLQNLTFPHPGAYEFSLSVDGHIEAAVPLQVVHAATRE